MPQKLGNGGYSSENYDADTGKYSEDGRPNSSYDNPKEKIVLTNNQKKYFENSKMRDENGNLMVMYHGTQEKFDSFDTSRFGQNGTFLTSSKDVAKTYAGDGNIVEGYVNLQNPYIIDNQHSIYWDSLIPNELLSSVEEKIKIIENSDSVSDLDFIINKDGVAYDIYAQAMNEKYGKKLFEEKLGYYEDLDLSDVQFTYENFLEDPYIESGLTTRELTEYAYNNGYDGVIFKNIIDLGSEFTDDEDVPSDIAVIFKPNQFKDIDNLNPTSSNDIYENKEKSEKVKAEKLYDMNFGD